MNPQWLTSESAVLLPGQQGIRYVEMSAAAPARLIVHLYADEPSPALSPSDFDLDGGRPITIDKVEGADKQWTLSLSAVGDHFSYRLGLRDRAQAPVRNPFYASTDFYFPEGRIEGDGRAESQVAPRVRAKRPAVDLLTKDFTSFVNLLADRVRISNPHWADLSPASLERVFIELLAHQADMLSYYQDRVINEAFVEDATQRYSLHQHALLLGASLFDGAAAETVLSFCSETTGYVRAGLEVAMRERSARRGVVFHTLAAQRIVRSHGSDRLRLTAWPGVTDAVVPAGTARIVLVRPDEPLAIGQRLAFTQGASFEFCQIVTITKLRDCELHGWVVSPDEVPGAKPLQACELLFHPPLALAVQPWRGGSTFKLHGNLADARFGRRVTSRVSLLLDARAADLHGSVVVGVDSAPQTYRLAALRLPERPVVFAVDRTGRGAARPVIDEVAIGGQRYDRRDHLHGSQPYDRHYVATSDEDGSVWLQFGDGRRGALVPLTAAEPAPELTIHYRVGEAIAGNCAPGTLSSILDGEQTLGLPGLAVANVTSGSGGRQAEALNAARLRLPASLRHGPIERAVSLDDYARAAEGVPGVGRAVARSVGSPFATVMVLVDPEDRTELLPELREAVTIRLSEVRSAGREVVVCGPSYVPLDIALHVWTNPEASPDRVRDRVYAALRPGSETHPGFFHPNRLSFGQSVELAAVLATVQRIAGVRGVEATRFRRYGPHQALPAVVSRIGLSVTEIARLDADPDAPAHGVLAVEVELSVVAQLEERV